MAMAITQVHQLKVKVKPHKVKIKTVAFTEVSSFILKGPKHEIFGFGFFT